MAKVQKQILNFFKTQLELMLHNLKMQMELPLTLEQKINDLIHGVEEYTK